MKTTIITVALSMMIFVSCTDILDTMPSDNISDQLMWTTEDLVDQGINGVYNSLQFSVQGDGMIGRPGDIGFFGFEPYGMTGQCENAIHNLFSAGVDAGNVRFSKFWQWCYTGIHRSNAGITAIGNVPMNEAKKNRLIAECKILRAFFYMRLNELYGRNGIGVPLYTEAATMADMTKGQSPESEVWDQIIKDLTEAINEPNLKDNDIEGEGRVNRGAAYALRGRAYLINKNYAEAISDFEKVSKCGYKLHPDYKALFKVSKERCEEMIMSVQYIDNPNGYGSSIQGAYGASQQGAQGSAWAWNVIQPTPAAVELYEVIVDNKTVKPFDWNDFFPNWNTISQRSTANRKVYFIRDKYINGKEIHASLVSAIVNTTLRILPSDIQALYLPEGNEARIKKAYANRDPRLALNVVVPYSNFLGLSDNAATEGWYTYRYPANRYFINNPNSEPLANPSLPDDYYTTGVCAQVPEFKYMFRKFVGEGREYMRLWSAPIDEPIIRYAHVLLMWAEALAEMNKPMEAMAKVKEVRDRAGVPTMASSFSSQTAAINYIRDESRREFLGEGVNFFEEMRWKTLKETKYSQLHAQHIWGGTENTGGTYQWPGDHFYTWPVPKAEVEMNPNLNKTPGWPY